jgi:hypothetical protein
MKRYLLIFLATWLVTTSILVGAGIIIDPYRIFHPPWVRDDYFLPNTRIQASGVINHVEFDSIILGTSMAANFSPDEASKLFKEDFVNISLAGSSQSERAIVLEYALKNRKISKVIYSLDGFGKAPIDSRPIAPYTYLYDDSLINDIHIYSYDVSNLKYLFCGNIFWGERSSCPETRSLETLTEWASNNDHSMRFGGLDKWLSAKNNGQIKEALTDVTNSIKKIETGIIPPSEPHKIQAALEERTKSFHDYLLKYVIDHPETDFYLFFPPYSRLRYAIWKQSDPNAFQVYVETLRMVVNETSKYPNVFIYGFDDQSFLDDLANYKDTSHYSPEYNSSILTWIKNGKHLLTTENLENYISAITNKAEQYSVIDIGHQIKKYIDSDA